jgi:hypothetical protein
MMLELAHSVPGRLRVHVVGLRGRAGIADEVRAAVLAIPGVSNATANAVTGSVIVSYDPQRLSVSELWDELKVRIGPICSRFEPVAEYRAPLADAPNRSRVDAVMDAALAAVLERLFERSALALVRAVI